MKEALKYRKSLETDLNFWFFREIRNSERKVTCSNTQICLPQQGLQIKVSTLFVYSMCHQKYAVLSASSICSFFHICWDGSCIFHLLYLGILCEQFIFSYLPLTLHSACIKIIPFIHALIIPHNCLVQVTWPRYINCIFKFNFLSLITSLPTSLLLSPIPIYFYEYTIILHIYGLHVVFWPTNTIYNDQIRVIRIAIT